MRIHFIAIGGAAMHNLALALHAKGFQISGSDDQIFEPSRSRLAEKGLLPTQEGWFPELLSSDIDAVILGMHARKDNPELLKAQSLGLRIYSYPEYLYEQTQNKCRVVIGGSHGKTTITAMVMHVLSYYNLKFDFMVGALLEGFDTMVSLSDDTDIAIFEGDEYLSSPLDMRPKFHWYKPHVAVLSGVAWDHVNVFPTWENYVEQFRIFADSIEHQGSLFYYEKDPILVDIASQKRAIYTESYNTFPHVLREGITYLQLGEKEYPLLIFGAHNLQNISAAYRVCLDLGIGAEAFAEAMCSFAGASKRLQTLYTSPDLSVFLDFAHSPSKLQATVSAVKEQFPQRTLLACMELHTFSSLSKSFLQEYAGTMDKADLAFVFFDEKVLASKRLEAISKDEVAAAFNIPAEFVLSSKGELEQALEQHSWDNTSLLMMSSGTFGGLDLAALMARKIETT